MCVYVYMCICDVGQAKAQAQAAREKAAGLEEDYEVLTEDSKPPVLIYTYIHTYVCHVDGIYIYNLIWRYI